MLKFYFKGDNNLCNNHRTEAISPNIDSGITMEDIENSNTFTNPDELILNSSQNMIEDVSAPRDWVTGAIADEPFSKRNPSDGYLYSTQSMTNNDSREKSTSTFEYLNTGRTILDPNEISAHPTSTSTESITLVNSQNVTGEISCALR